VKIGVWEYGQFIGCVIFSQGATPDIGMQFKLGRLQICELTRVALGNHETPVSRIIAIALKMIRKYCPKLRAVISFADQRQGHHGGIYQAAGWFYLGVSISDYIRVNGKEVHPKTLHSRYGVGGQSIPWLRTHVDPKAARTCVWNKHKYIMPLDDDTRKRIESLAKPYPKRAESIASDATAIHAVKGGATPTSALSAQAE
jgi:hypothetical protein